MNPHASAGLLRLGAPSSPGHVPTDFVLHNEGPLRIVWAPLEYINTTARVVLVGITPGWQQTEIAYRTAAAALADGHSYEVACRAVKEAASFAGPMRRNLVQMLDEIGLHRALRLDTVNQLFGPVGRHLLHTTSALRYPVFRNGKNYTGHSPKPLQHPVLRRAVEDTLAPELAAVPGGLIVPLGKAAGECVQHAERVLGRVLPVLDGFPHPSGANGHRKRQLAANRDELAAAVSRWAA